MILQGWKRLFGDVQEHGFPPPAAPISPAPIIISPAEFTHHSSALDQFFLALQGQVGLNILDLGGVNQANADYFNNLEHTVRFDNFVRALDESFGKGDFCANQQDEECIDQFQSKVLNYDDDSLDGILVWDSLQYLSPELLAAAVDQLHSILHKGSQMLTSFHTNEKAPEVPLYSYRISARNRMTLTLRNRRKPAQYFSTRSLEKLFRNFSSVKFFLTQDSLREVIVRK